MKLTNNNFLLESALRYDLMRHFLVFLTLLLSLTPFAYAAKQEVISVAAIDWCPQICPEAKDKGYIYDIIKAFAQSKNYVFKVDFIPWPRAIREVTRGKYTVLLAPTKKEAPELVFGKSEVGIQRMCFYADLSQKWKYQGKSSISPQMRFLAALGGSLVELEEFARKSPDQFILIPSTDEVELAKLLVWQKADAFIFTKKTMDAFIKKKGASSRLKEVGCLKDEKLFAGFSPLPFQRSRRLARELDQFIERSHQNGFINKTLKKYSLGNWRK